MKSLLLIAIALLLSNCSEHEMSKFNARATMFKQGAQKSFGGYNPCANSGEFWERKCQEHKQELRDAENLIDGGR